MPARSRTVDPALWQKPEFMRATPLARELWLGLICVCADDEGRFEADSWAITQRLFPRSHPATEEAVDEAISYWHDAGWLLTYMDGEKKRLGFLQGWFEHQYIRDPEPSSFPPPPVLVASWRDVQAVKSWYVAERGGKDNTHFRTVLREFAQSVQTDRKLSVQKVRTQYGLSSHQVRVEWKGKEGKGTQYKTTLSAAERKRKRQVALEAERLKLMDSIPEADHCLLLSYIENAAQENKSKQISLGGEVTRLSEVLAVRTELIAANQISGHEAWRYGMEQANARNAPNANYVKKASANWTTGFAEFASSGVQSSRYRGPRAADGWVPWRITEAGVRQNADTMTRDQIEDIIRTDADGDWDRELGLWKRDPDHPANVARRAAAQ